MTEHIPLIAMTGGPGGRKNTLLRHRPEDPVLDGRVVVMEQAIHLLRFVRLSPMTPTFQCALVAVQAGTEDFLRQNRQRIGTTAIEKPSRHAGPVRLLAVLRQLAGIVLRDDRHDA